MKKSKLLYVVSILLIVYSGFLLLRTADLLRTGHYMFEGLVEHSAAMDLVNMVIVAMYAAIAIFELVGGILGVISYNKPYKYTSFMIGSGVGMILMTVGLAIPLAMLIPHILENFSGYIPNRYVNMLVELIMAMAFILGVFVMAILPILYTIGAVRHNNFSKEALQPEPEPYRPRSLYGENYVPKTKAQKKQTGQLELLKKPDDEPAENSDDEPEIIVEPYQNTDTDYDDNAICDPDPDDETDGEDE